MLVNRFIDTSISSQLEKLRYLNILLTVKVFRALPNRSDWCCICDSSPSFGVCSRNCPNTSSGKGTMSAEGVTEPNEQVAVCAGEEVALTTSCLPKSLITRRTRYRQICWARWLSSMQELLEKLDSKGKILRQHWFSTLPSIQNNSCKTRFE